MEKRRKFIEEQIKRDTCFMSMALNLAGLTIASMDAISAKVEAKKKGEDVEVTAEEWVYLCDAQVWANELLSLTFLIHFAVVDMMAESIKKCFDGLEKSGQTVRELMKRVRVWEKEQRKNMADTRCVNRVKGMISEYDAHINFDEWTEEHDKEVIIAYNTYVLRIARNLILYFPKDRLITLFHYVFEPRHLALINPHDPVAHYYHSLLVFFYQRVLKSEAVIYGRHADYALIIRVLQRKLKEILHLDLLHALRAANKKVCAYA
jgi:hypothetical protein